MGKSVVLLLIRIFLVSLFVVQFYEVAKSNDDYNSSDDWTMFHHDVAHTGYSASSAVKKPVLLWITSKGYGGSPIVANGYVYLLDSGHLYCARSSDGHHVWNQSLPSGLSNSYPAIYEGYVYTPLTAYNDASTGELDLQFSILHQHVHSLDISSGSMSWNGPLQQRQAHFFSQSQ